MLYKFNMRDSFTEVKGDIINIKIIADQYFFSLFFIKCSQNNLRVISSKLIKYSSLKRGSPQLLPGGIPSTGSSIAWVTFFSNASKKLVTILGIHDKILWVIENSVGLYLTAFGRCTLAVASGFVSTRSKSVTVLRTSCGRTKLWHCRFTESCSFSYCHSRRSGLSLAVF